MERTDDTTDTKPEPIESHTDRQEDAVRAQPVKNSGTDDVVFLSVLLCDLSAMALSCFLLKVQLKAQLLRVGESKTGKEKDR